MSRLIGWLILLPFAGVFWLTWKAVNACAKKGGFLRLIGALLSLVVGGFSIYAGWQIGPIVGWFIMVCGGGLAIFGTWRVLTATKEELEWEELEEKLNKEMKKVEQEREQRPRQVKGVQQTLACPSCGSLNVSGYRFCRACGMELVIHCPNCGGTASPACKFCTSCGARLS